MVKTRQWILAKKPTDLATLEGPDATFQHRETDLPEPQEGELLVKLLYLSNDPAQRISISADIPDDRQYMPPVKEGAVMRANALGEVVESRADGFKKGDHVMGAIGWTEYAILNAAEARPAPPLPDNRPETLYLGALGGTGLTAFIGLTEVGNVSPLDSIVVSGAAGATGNMVVQLAKHVFGCRRVVGIAGGAKKCKWVEQLGADQCLDYKSSTFTKDLSTALSGPNEKRPTVYFDNVGGAILDQMLTLLAKDGRVVACGAIAGYNSSPEKSAGLKKWYNVVTMRLRVRGFIVLDHMDLWAAGREALVKALAEGKIKVEGGEQVVDADFDQVPQTWNTLFEGGNTGKLVTKLR